LQETVNLTDIDSTTRAVDFWFNNIFTDMNVRAVIGGHACKRIAGILEKIL
jgi:hypothetical protein